MVADIHIQHYPTMRTVSSAISAAVRVKNTAANPDTPTIMANAQNIKLVLKWGMR